MSHIFLNSWTLIVNRLHFVPLHECSLLFISLYENSLSFVPLYEYMLLFFALSICYNVTNPSFLSLRIPAIM